MNSISDLVNITCVNCSSNFTANIFFVVNIFEMEHFITERSFSLTKHACPHCNVINEIDFPIVLVDGFQSDEILFFPSSMMDYSNNIRYLNQVLQIDLSNIEINVIIVPRSILIFLENNGYKLPLRECINNMFVEKIEEFQKNHPNIFNQFLMEKPLFN